ncbi:MAG TPA: RICIN domain-containing protein [Microlunatus sp.]|nr:RICIN domain-containing protein [Microlunatus sp.]
MSQSDRVMCDMRSASDTPEQRAAEYRHLFDTALCGRDQTERMVRFRFRSADVDEDQLRDLAAREQACCPFFSIRLMTSGGELWWETRVDDTPEARALLEEFSRLPDRHESGTTVDRLIDGGLLVAAAADPTPITSVPPVAALHGRRTNAGLRAVLTALAALVLLLGLGSQAQASVGPGYYQVVNHQTGECLDVWGASTAHGANVGVWRCVGADNQLWRLQYVGDGFYQVRVLHTDMCLDVAYRGYYDGADVVQATCADPSLATSYNQQWRKAYVGGYYQLVARHSGKCLDKTGSGDVVQWTCGDSGKWWQQWSFR